MQNLSSEGALRGLLCTDGRGCSALRLAPASARGDTLAFAGKLPARAASPLRVLSPPLQT